MDPRTIHHIERFRTWAQSKPSVRRLWLFGSRAAGKPRRDSDIDIAIEIDPLQCPEAIAQFRDDTFPRWRCELQALSQFAVHLEPWAGEGTNIASYVRSSGQLLYERAV